MLFCCIYMRCLAIICKSKLFMFIVLLVYCLIIEKDLVIPNYETRESNPLRFFDLRILHYKCRQNVKAIYYINRLLNIYHITYVVMKVFHIGVLYSFSFLFYNLFFSCACFIIAFVCFHKHKYPLYNINLSPMLVLYYLMQS